jgi:hypothetical protein
MHRYSVESRCRRKHVKQRTHTRGGDGGGVRAIITIDLVIAVAVAVAVAVVVVVVVIEKSQTRSSLLCRILFCSERGDIISKSLYRIVSRVLGVSNRHVCVHKFVM